MAEKTELLEEDEKVVEIELERLRGFENHPFKVRADSQMIELQESIKKYGILNPLIVRPKKDGCYEIISGHRRKFAAEKIGYRKVPVIIRVLKDDEAVVLMVDSNLQREMISPSEKAFALLFAVVTLLIPQVVMRMYTQDAEIIRLGEIYFRFSVITYFFLGLSLVCTIILRCVGQVKLPLLVSIGAFFVNLLANYVFIFGKLGMPRMGIAGAALGTLIARLFEAGMICGYLLLKDEKIGFRVKHLGMKTADLLGEYIRISIPVLISDGILAIGNNTVAMVIGRLGVTFVAANAITSVTQQLSTVMIQGVCQAGAIVTGQTLGEGKQEQAQSQAYRFLGLGLGLGMLSAFFIMAVSPAIIGSYKVSEETAEVAAQLMHAISLILIFQATNSIMTKGVLRGGGDTKMLMLADNLFLWVVSIPLGMLAGFVFHFPAFWIYVCLKADQILKAVWCVFRLRSGKWMKKITVGKVSGQEDRA